MAIVVFTIKSLPHLSQRAPMPQHYRIFASDAQSDYGSDAQSDHTCTSVVQTVGGREEAEESSCQSQPPGGAAGRGGVCGSGGAAHTTQPSLPLAQRALQQAQQVRTTCRVCPTSSSASSASTYMYVPPAKVKMPYGYCIACTYMTLYMHVALDVLLLLQTARLQRYQEPPADAA